MQWIFRKIWLPLYGKWVLRHTQQERTFEYAGLRVKVPPGVFHPGVFFSTTIFVDFLKDVDFQGKKVLDVGTGSGLLALFAAKQGALASAIDINPLAVETARENAEANKLTLAVVESDLFDQIPDSQTFDYLLINPPYFAAEPKDIAAQAFFAGENLEYFEKLFAQMSGHIHPDSKIWMILAGDCDLDKIGAIAEKHDFSSITRLEKSKWARRLVIHEYS